jgi:hypothetical protein
MRPNWLGPLRHQSINWYSLCLGGNRIEAMIDDLGEKNKSSFTHRIVSMPDLNEALMMLPNATLFTRCA